MKKLPEFVAKSVLARALTKRHKHPHIMGTARYAGFTQYGNRRMRKLCRRESIYHLDISSALGQELGPELELNLTKIRVSQL